MSIYELKSNYSNGRFGMRVVAPISVGEAYERSRNSDPAAKKRLELVDKAGHCIVQEQVKPVTAENIEAGQLVAGHEAELKELPDAEGQPLVGSSQTLEDRSA